MPKIIKTEAVVLRNLKYGDTSKITVFYTPEHGKLHGILKGGRSANSKFGGRVDLLNHVEIIFYEKPNRDIQLVSDAQLISNFTHIKEDLEKMKYASAVLELVFFLTFGNDSNSRLFNGVVRILNLINSDDEIPPILFARFLLFFCEEIGYGLHFDKCALSGVELKDLQSVAFNYETGFFDPKYKHEHFVLYEFSRELFKFLTGLSKRKKIINFDGSFPERIINFIEKFLKYHVEEFKGITSLQLY